MRSRSSTLHESRQCQHFPNTEPTTISNNLRTNPLKIIIYYLFTYQHSPTTETLPPQNHNILSIHSPLKNPLQIHQFCNQRGYMAISKQPMHNFIYIRYIGFHPRSFSSVGATRQCKEQMIYIPWTLFLYLGVCCRDLSAKGCATMSYPQRVFQIYDSLLCNQAPRRHWTTHAMKSARRG